MDSPQTHSHKKPATKLKYKDTLKCGTLQIGNLELISPCEEENSIPSLHSQQQRQTVYTYKAILFCLAWHVSCVSLKKKVLSSLHNLSQSQYNQNKATLSILWRKRSKPETLAWQVNIAQTPILYLWQIEYIDLRYFQYILKPQEAPRPSGRMHPCVKWSINDCTEL